MFKKVDAEVQNVRSIIEGHHRFLDRVTGTTVDPKLKEYIKNLDGVLNNNLHFLQETHQEGKPNADATTEGQSVMIIGYLYCYLGTGDKKYLERAEWMWEAYVRWFYKGQPIPDTPQRWVCNWIINGKEPVLANYPLNPIDPTHGGFKGIPLNWTNGLTKIPKGAPYWGEYLDVATFAFDGALSYDSIKASVKALKPDGSTDWDSDGVKYDVDWLILWTGDKVNGRGKVVSSGHTEEEKGTVQLKDTTVQGIHKFNFATRNPLEHGGYLIDRNEPFHNRPIHTPLGDIVNNLGNAADGEVWFLDACYLLWKATGKDYYKKALDSVHYTANEYTFIDSTNKFFRRDMTANTPFTEGISYDYSYPATEIIYNRDKEGYIQAIPKAPTKMTLEQKSVVFRVNTDSKVRTNYGGYDDNGDPIQAEVKLGIADIKTDDGFDYGAAFPAKLSGEVEEVEIPLTHFVRRTKDNGENYLLASESATADYGGCTATLLYKNDIDGETLDGGARTANTVYAEYIAGDGGLIIGFWLTETVKADVTGFVYRSNAPMKIDIKDDLGWEWYWTLPKTNGVWTQTALPRSELALSEYQPAFPKEEPRPTVPQYEGLKQMEIVASTKSDCYLEYYCVNEMPPAFNSDDGFVTRFAITLSSNSKDANFVAKIGNCDIKDPREDYLSYCPGLIPFSNIYTVGSNEIGPWHGLPYPGYQAPSMYCLGLGEDQEIRLKNSIDFMYDSQVWYAEKYGVLGPCASAYIWDRWDAIEYGPPDTFTEYHWVEGKAWSGYQPRGFAWMCRCWQQIVDNGEEVPEKLRLFCENWITYLWEFSQREDNPEQWLPYEFYPEKPAFPEDDFNAGMGGLYLSGVCMAAMAGSKLPFIHKLISVILVDFERNYTILPKYPDDIMNGSYSSWYGGRYFYGFHGSEALKGLGAYLMYKKHQAGTPTNYTGTVPKGSVIIPKMHDFPIRPAGEVAPTNEVLVFDEVRSNGDDLDIYLKLPDGVSALTITIDGNEQTVQESQVYKYPIQALMANLFVVIVTGDDGKIYTGTYISTGKEGDDTVVLPDIPEPEEAIKDMSYYYWVNNPNSNMKMKFSIVGGSLDSTYPATVEDGTVNVTAYETYGNLDGNVDLNFRLGDDQFLRTLNQPFTTTVKTNTGKLLTISSVDGEEIPQ